MIAKIRGTKEQVKKNAPHSHLTRQKLVKVVMVTVDITGRLELKWSPYCQSKVEAAVVLCGSSLWEGKFILVSNLFVYHSMFTLSIFLFFPHASAYCDHV